MRPTSSVPAFRSRILKGGGTPPDSPAAPSGSLAKTGAEMTPWALGSAAALVAIGCGTVWMARRPPADPANACNSPQE
ncbi:LAETG motif-containing sortase-dependent surface protein [Streptomyces noursei]|uniref:LAETG motif-containing sortase-dependent surface protein n=1 Tax=Streptomyces noursei TaxID=1971 RepID=UPI0035DF6129